MAALRPSLVLLLLAAACAAPAGADIYRWTDADGRVHFGDSAAGAQVGGKAKAVTPSSTTTAPSADSRPGTAKPAATTSRPTAATSSASGPAARDLLERQRRISDVLQQEEAERQRAAHAQEQEQARRAQDCAQVRRDLASMDGRAAYYTNDTGERIYLDEAQRQSYIAQVNTQLAEHCR